MKTSLLGGVLVGVLLAFAPRAGAEPVPARPESISFQRFGRVPLVWPESAPRSVAVLLSSGEESSTAAKALADTGALVLRVDTARYLDQVPRAAKCVYPAGELEALSQFTQKEVGLPEYLHPTLVGTGPGAALAYASLAQAPENTFRGAVSLGFRPELTVAVPICRGNGFSRSRSAKGTAEVLQAVPAVTAPWRLLPGPREGNAELERQRSFAGAITGAQAVPLPEGAQSPEARKALLQHVYAEVSDPPTAPVAVAPAAPSGSAPADQPIEPVGDLPLVEVPAATPSPDSFAILLSGDGGWAGIDKHLASALNTQGLSVVGWDSLRYFWKRRTPEDTAKDIGRAIEHYLAAWGARRVVLVGYSRGADVLPAIVARLPAPLREKVRLVALVAPGKSAEFEVHVTDLLGGGGGDYPVLPEVKALGGLPVLCLYGDEEVQESVCPQLTEVPGVKELMLSGGHHFGGNYARVARAIIDALGP